MVSFKLMQFYSECCGGVIYFIVILTCLYQIYTTPLAVLCELHQGV